MKGKYSEIETVESNDLSALLNLICERLDDMGKPSKFTNDKAGFAKFQADTKHYFESLRTANSDDELLLVPSVEGWAASCGICRTSLFYFARRGPEWHDYIENVKNAILACKQQLACRGKLPALLYVFDAANNGTAYHDARGTTGRNDMIVEEKPDLAKIKAAIGIQTDDLAEDETSLFDEIDENDIYT